MTKFAMAAVGGVLLALAPQAQATTINLTVGDTHAVGYVNPGVSFGDGDIPGYVNQFVGMALNSSYSAFYANHNNTWVRSGNSFPLTDVAVGGYPSQGNITSFNIVSGNEYLVAKYDGPNGGLEVWYIGDLSGDTLNIPATAAGTLFGQDSSTQYGLSGTWVLNGAPPSVPDGGLTVILLGATLSGLAFVRRIVR